ncbi:MAG: phospholipase D-like domain-containing protein [Polyangiales bacterium]
MEDERRDPVIEAEERGTITLLRDGAQAYPRWLAAIAAAQSEVLLEMYWFDSDSIGTRFADALTACAQRGVHVYVLYDGFGSLGVDDAQWQRIRAAGAHVIEFHPIHPWAERFKLSKVQQRDHRKILVVDAHVGFTGGINICDHNLPESEGGRGWRDDSVEVRGEAVLELRALFFDTWLRVGGPAPVTGAAVGWRVRRALTQAACEQVDSEDVGAFAKSLDAAMDALRLATSRRRRRTRKQGRARRKNERRQHGASVSRAQIIGHDSWGATRTIRNVYVRKIRAASRVILIANSYFAPDLPVRRALIEAAERGVEVRVLVPRKSDIAAVAWAGRALYAGLLRGGVHIHEWTGSMLHSKTAVIDGWATVGSYNFDYRSLRYNLEVTAASTEPAFVREVEESIREDIGKSEEVHRTQWTQRPWWHRAVEWLAYLVRKIL